MEIIYNDNVDRKIGIIMTSALPHILNYILKTTWSNFFLQTYTPMFRTLCIIK